MSRFFLFFVLMIFIGISGYSQAVPKKFIPKKAGEPKPARSAPAIPPSVKAPNRDAAKKSTTQNRSQKFEPIFSANDDCLLEIDGKPYGNLLRDQPKLILLNAGTHRLRARSLNSSEIYTAGFNVIGNSQLVSIAFEELVEAPPSVEYDLFPSPVSYQPLIFKDSFSVNKEEAPGIIPGYVENSSILMIIHELSSNMVSLPGGKFDNGDMKPNSGIVWKDSVTIDPFQLGKYEVTQRQWQQVMGYNNSINKECADCPVENVSWNEIAEFLRIVNLSSGKRFRLPTNAEYEFAVRMDVREYIDKRGGFKYGDLVAWHEKNAQRQTHPVGSKIPHRAGVFDLMGNVSEWCADWYDPGYSQYNKVLKNPVGPATGNRKVVSGGSFANSDFVKSDFLNPMEKQKTIGFRLVEYQP